MKNDSDPIQHLLIVSNTPSPNTKKLADAIVEGAKNKDIDDVEVEFLEPLNASADDVLSADGIIIGTTENFGYMSGQIKDFFERIYYPCLEQTQGLPYALFVKGGLDGTGAKLSVEKIITGLRWKEVQQPLIMKGEFQSKWLADCEELGMYVAAGLEAKIF